MNCRRVNKRIEAYLDGDLDARSQKKVERHLELCARCRQSLAKAQRTDAALREMTPASPPEGFSRQVMSRLPEAVPPRRASPRLLSLPAFARWKLRPLVAGAVLLSLLVGGYLWLKWRGEQPTPVSRKSGAEISRRLVAAWEYLSRGDFDSAIVAYQEAIDLESHSADARLGLGYALWKKGASDEAVKQYEEVIALRSATPRSLAMAHESLGKIYQDQGHVEKAAECYESAVRLDPNLIDSHANLAVIYEQWGLESEAMSEYEAIASINPTSSFAYEALGRIHERSGELDEGAEAYRRSIEATGSAVAYWRLGRLYEKMGCLEEATAAYQMAVFPGTGTGT